MRKDEKPGFKRVLQIVFACLVALTIIGVLVFVTYGRAVPVLNPHGLIADQERNLIFVTLALAVIVVVPVFIMLFTIAWKYRASNTKAVYQPDFATHKGIEALWWGIPCAIILALAVITTVYTHALDPYKAIDSQVKPVNIQVVALDWKWLFIYPDQATATLNYLNIPKDTPINFTITSDAPMNSFWIPALAGQVYAMSGMSTQLHVMADSVGTYPGSSANISGEGFASMHFKVNVMDQPDFTKWTKKARQSDNILTSVSYQTLAQPSRDNPETTYELTNPALYNEVIAKYGSGDLGGSTSMSGMGN